MSFFLKKIQSKVQRNEGKKTAQSRQLIAHGSRPAQHTKQTSEKGNVQKNIAREEKLNWENRIVSKRHGDLEETLNSPSVTKRAHRACNKAERNGEEKRQQAIESSSNKTDVSDRSLAFGHGQEQSLN